MKSNALIPRFVAGLLWFGVSAFAQQSSVPEYTATVELPRVTVAAAADLPPPESWYYAQIDGFDVLANGSKSDANKLLKDFQKFRKVLKRLDYAPEVSGVPATLILCGAGNKFDDFISKNPADKGTVTSRFLSGAELRTIVLDLETKSLFATDLTGADSTGADAEFQIDHNRQLYREYIRYILSQTTPPPPIWYLEGIAQMVMDIKFHNRSIHFGELDTRAPYIKKATGDVNAGAGAIIMTAGNMSQVLTMGYSMEKGMPGVLSDPEDDSGSAGGAIVGDDLFTKVFQHRNFIPFETFFAVTADSPEARNAFGNNLWAKQAYAFVQMCLFKRDLKYVEPFKRFLERLSKEPVSETLFKECFGLTYKEMTKEMGYYINAPHHRFRDIKLTKEGELTATDVSFREATQSEVGRIKGDALRLAGRTVDALRTYQLAYARGERDLELIAALGVAEQETGHLARARKLLEAAVNAGTVRPSAYTTLARIYLDEALANPKATGPTPLTTVQIQSVLELLLRAHALPPALPQTYELMAEALARCTTVPPVQLVHLAGQGVLKFPTNIEHTLNTAQLFVRAGDNQNAANVARLGIRYTTDEATRKRFEDFLSTLPAPASTPASSPSNPTPAQSASVSTTNSTRQ